MPLSLGALHITLFFRCVISYLFASTSTAQHLIGLTPSSVPCTSGPCTSGPGVDGAGAHRFDDDADADLQRLLLIHNLITITSA